MTTLLNEFRTRCREAALDLMWRQWCSLGVAGYAAPANPGLMIDLEALVLATTSLGRNDPRLFDEALDWLGSFGFLVSLQRMANLHRRHGLGEGAVLAAVAEWLEKNTAQPRWRALAKKGARNRGESRQEPLFVGMGGSVAGGCDEVFLSHGLERTSVQVRGMSRAPRPLLAANLMASLRALMGLSARVEVLLYLIGSPVAANASEIARATGHAPRTLQAVLQEMRFSGQLLCQEPPMPRAAPARLRPRYQLQASDWAFLTHGEPLPRWTAWSSLFRLAEAVLAIIPAPEAKPAPPTVVSSRLRNVLIAEGSFLAAAGILSGLDIRPEASGQELVETLADRLPALLHGL